MFRLRLQVSSTLTVGKNTREANKGHNWFRKESWHPLLCSKDHHKLRINFIYSGLISFCTSTIEHSRIKIETRIPDSLVDAKLTRKLLSKILTTFSTPHQGLTKIWDLTIKSPTVNQTRAAFSQFFRNLKEGPLPTWAQRVVILAAGLSAKWAYHPKSEDKITH